MGRCGDARVGSNGSAEVVQRALESHQLRLQQLELHALHADLVEGVVGRREELDVRVEDAERVDRRHQLRDLLLQCRDERGELLHAARRTSLDPHGDPLAHPHGDAFERSPRDRADDGSDSCSSALGDGWRRRARTRGCRRLPERRPQVGNVLRSEVGIGVAHATSSSAMRASARVIGRDRAGVGRSARCASTRDLSGGQPSA